MPSSARARLAWVHPPPWHFPKRRQGIYKRVPHLHLDLLRCRVLHLLLKKSYLRPLVHPFLHQMPRRRSGSFEEIFEVAAIVPISLPPRYTNVSDGLCGDVLGFLGKWVVGRHPVPDVLHKFCGISGGFLTAQACNQIEGHIDPRRNTG